MKKRALIFTFILAIYLFANVSAFEFCDYGEEGNDLEIIDVQDMKKDNSDRWEWEPLENIEIEVRVENQGEDAHNFVVELTFVENDSEIDLASSSSDLKEDIYLDPDEDGSVTFEFEVDDDAQKGEYEIYVKFYKDNDEDEECTENNDETTEITFIEVCEDPKVSVDLLEIYSINDNNKDNENDWEWSPLNEINLEIEIKNKNYDDDDFVLELILLDEDNDEVDFAKDDDDIKEDISLPKDEKKEFTFNFQLQGDLDEGDYTLFAKVYHEDNDSICTSLKAEEADNYEKIKIDKFDHNILIDKVSGPKELYSGQEITYTITIMNTGNENEPKVKINIYNYQLNLSDSKEITNLSSGSEKEVTFTFTVPETITNMTNKILFSTEFDYDTEKEYYQQESAEDDDIKVIVELIKQEKDETIEYTESTPEEEIKEETISEQTQNNTQESGIQQQAGETENTSNDFSKIIIFLLIIAALFVGGIVLYQKLKNNSKQKAIYDGTYGMYSE